ncbi:hypothetical protein AB0D66_27935, partial [Streptomyces sp. NPDC048270]
RGERALRRGNWKYYRGKAGRDQLFARPADRAGRAPASGGRHRRTKAEPGLPDSAAASTAVSCPW